MKYFLVKANNVEVAALDATIDFRPDAQTRASVTLDPTDANAVTLGEATSYDIYFVDKALAGSEAVKLIMSGAVPVAADYSGAYSPPANGDGGSIHMERVVTLQDRLWAFKDAAPGDTITHENTDSHAELAYVAQQVGASGAATNCPPVAIPRIDYTRESGYWSPLFTYFSPWSPQVFIDPSSAQIRVTDTTIYDDTATRAQSALTTAAYNNLKPRDEQRIVPTQFRVDYLEFAGDGNTRRIPAAPRRENEVRVQLADGSTTVTWSLVEDLYENEDDPTEVTRTVPVGDGQAQISADHEEIGQSETTIEYEADWTRPKKQTTVIKAVGELPGIGTTYREAERTIETHTYEPHELLPGRDYLIRTEKKTTGLYIYTDTGDREQDLLTATTFVNAGLSRTVSVDGGSQRWEDGEIRYRCETFHRTAGSDFVTVTTVERDIKRGRITVAPRKLQIGDILTGTDGFAKFVYVPETGGAGRRAEVIDATMIGMPLGVELANARLSRAGTSVRTLTLDLLKPEYTKYRFGWIVALHTDAPWGFDGPYRCVGVRFIQKGYPESLVTETLTLAREW